VATFEDGYRSTCLVEAMLKSHALGSVWQKVETVPARTGALHAG
jgi:hypothetical protein